MAAFFRFLRIVLFLGSGGLLEAQLLPPLSAQDVLMEARSDGFHLWIRHQPGVASVMLTEAFEAPRHQLATYALRAVEANPVNDNEPRLLDGKPLALPHHSLLSSTVKIDPQGREAFEVVVPSLVEYGSRTNPNSRYGRWDLRQLLAQPSSPVWFSIRTFSKPYADYTGVYRDNAFSLRALQAQQLHSGTGKYEDGLLNGFSRLGPTYPAQDVDDALEAVKRFLAVSGGSEEVVLAIDTTQSMGKSIKSIASRLVDVLRSPTGASSIRAGLVLYRDYMEDYLTQTVDFTSDWSVLQNRLSAAMAEGGGDIPEAVVEGMWAGLNSFPWSADHRFLIVLGDAPQHPVPRGAVTEAMVRQAAKDRQVELHLIMLPLNP